MSAAHALGAQEKRPNRTRQSPGLNLASLTRAIPTRTPQLEDLIQIQNSPGFIPGVFNYCNRRCERCEFEARCRLRADELRGYARHPNDDGTERLKRSFEQTSRLIRTWCERERIDGAAFDPDDHSEDFAEEFEARDASEKDSLLQVAARYAKTAMTLLEAFDRTRPSGGWTPVREALETIGWYSLRVSSKARRAASGFEAWVQNPARDIDPCQSDWNGTAKVLRLEIAESRHAWTVVLAPGAAPTDSPLRRLIATLDELDGQVAERFPRAMAFVRPGLGDWQQRQRWLAPIGLRGGHGDVQRKSPALYNKRRAR